MILAVIGIFVFILSLCILWLGVIGRDVIDLKPGLVLLVIALGLNVADPVVLGPVSNWFMTMPWVGSP